MYKKALLALLACSLFAFAIPAVAAPDGEPENQDFGDPYSPGGTPRCWDCIPSLSTGFTCKSTYMGFHGCQATVTVVNDQNGNPVVTVNCNVVPYGFCITVLP